jgi:prepilin-type N-terminal cleavage/methylation domain-containing protein
VVRNGRRAFTLVEAMVTTALVGIALAGALAGIASLSKADTRARDAELLQRLAIQKMTEFESVSDPREVENSGDFTDAGYPDAQWELTVETGGEENLDLLTITATRGTNEQVVKQLVYVPPITTTGGTP